MKRWIDVEIQSSGVPLLSASSNEAYLSVCQAEIPPEPQSAEESEKTQCEADVGADQKLAEAEEWDFEAARGPAPKRIGDHGGI